MPNIVANRVNLIQLSHVLTVSCKVKNEDLLTQNLQRFWDLNLLGIKENERSVYENVADEIKLEGNRYTLKLPFKEDHPVTPKKIICGVPRD